MFVATLVASGSMGQGDIAEAADRLRDAGCAPSDCCWLDTDKAADLFFAADPAAARAALAGMGAHIDLIVQASETRAKALLIADMDSTMITVECIDELADYAGIKPQIAEITERAMRGELDFAGALRERVALLKGLPDSAIDQCRAERVRVMPGAKAHVANVLEIADGALLGTVETPIVDAARKRAELDAAIAQGVERALTLAVGDGANDIPMIQGAGLGVAYHAKPKTREAAAAEIVHGDLSVLLYAQGIASEHWVVA